MNIQSLQRFFSHPATVTFFVTASTALLLTHLWMLLMFVGGLAGDEFLKNDFWKSAVITVLYLFALFVILHRKSIILLYLLSLLACAITTIVGFIFEQSLASGFGTLTSIIFLPFTVTVSALFIVFLTIFRSASRKSVLFAAGMCGAVMSLVFISMFVSSGILLTVLGCLVTGRCDE